MYYTYIVSNYSRTTFYTGMTNNLRRRIQQHKANRGRFKTFAGRYYCHHLVYYETFETPMEAIRREKAIKGMNRKEKIALIKSVNPGMDKMANWSLH